MMKSCPSGAAACVFAMLCTSTTERAGTAHVVWPPHDVVRRSAPFRRRAGSSPRAVPACSYTPAQFCATARTSARPRTWGAGDVKPSNALLDGAITDGDALMLP
jgi:hypothetical protein